MRGTAVWLTGISVNLVIRLQDEEPFLIGTLPVGAPRFAGTQRCGEMRGEELIRLDAVRL